MAPAVWARLAKVTGEAKYLDFMDQEHHATYGLLRDVPSRLFWRDSSFFNQREKNGEKLFRSRGNGWVIGGLAWGINYGLLDSAENNGVDCWPKRVDYPIIAKWYRQALDQLRHTATILLPYACP
jgi:hypothetical protein